MLEQRAGWVEGVAEQGGGSAAMVGGLPSGKYRRGVEPPAGSRHVLGWGEPPVYDEERLYDIVEELFVIADGHVDLADG